VEQVVFSTSTNRMSTYQIQTVSLRGVSHLKIIFTKGILMLPNSSPLAMLELMVAVSCMPSTVTSY